MKTRTMEAAAEKVPYCAQTADAAIAHLERVLTVEGACAIFGQRYWLERVQHLLAAPDLLPPHRVRLMHLLERLHALSVAVQT
ncbi:hypothetical protein [Paraburkholderia acidipaludis]|uniref:hypothetical protein n=1 Tax=Paraburkholderia acidipaludis TaxID=660537 RepID=UPI00047F3E1E|nr:hypothetical protein [Paraburkholderia acidipaludis]